MSSDDDGAQLMATFKRNSGRNAAPLKVAERPATSPGEFISENSSGAEDGTSRSDSTRARRALCVRVKPIDRKDEYVYYEPRDEVEGILREYSKKDDMVYEVRLFGDKTKQVSESSKGSASDQQRQTECGSCASSDSAISTAGSHPLALSTSTYRQLEYLISP